jgi:nucleoid-associated protein YgaU
MRYFLLVVGIIFLGGCLARTYTVEKPRVDTEISGNQGYLSGTPQPVARESKLRSTRTISVLEVELGPHDRPKDAAITGNRGYVVGEPQSQGEVERIEELEVVEVLPQEAGADKKYIYYTIEKDDTLQKISKKFYGTTKKWNLIYKENKEILKSSDKIYPGETIKIPVLE